MKNYFKIIAVCVLFSFANTLHAQKAGKGASCVDSSVADRNIEIVKVVAKSVGQASKTASKFLEEQPEAEVALAVVQVGAKLAGLIANAFKDNQMGNPWPVDIPFHNLREKPMKWNGYDGDVIEMSRKPGSGKLVFVQENSNWWKGIVAFDRNDTNKWFEFMCLYDNQEQMQMDITPQLANTHYVSLSKAKFAGVHTNMYLIANWGEADTNYDYFFKWVKS